jgi:hypothetical protein
MTNRRGRRAQIGIRSSSYFYIDIPYVGLVYWRNFFGWRKKLAGVASVATTEKWIGHRSEERKAVIGNIMFAGFAEKHGLISIGGVTSNISKSGACVYTRHKLEKEHIFTCYGKAFGNAARHAHIVWTRRVSKKVFVSGISFSE